MDTNLLGTGYVAGAAGEIPPTPFDKGGSVAAVAAPEVMVAADGQVYEVPNHLRPYAVGVLQGFPERWQLRAIGLGYLNASKIALRLRESEGLRPKEVSVSELFSPDGAWLWPYEGAANRLRLERMRIRGLLQEVEEEMAALELYVEQRAEQMGVPLEVQLSPDGSVRWVAAEVGAAPR